jgi:predicted oxidoreductase
MDLIPHHRRQMVAEVHPRVPVRSFEDLGEDLSVRTALFEIVATRSEVADDARDTTREGREGLALCVLRDVTVDAEVEVGVDRAGEHELSRGVYGLVGVA